MTHPLSLRHVKKAFRRGELRVAALNGVDMDVEQGEFVAIMGASGSGKSTLLHVMAGLTDVDEGQVCVDGQDLAALNDRALTEFRRRRIGIVFQAFNLVPVLTAEANIRLPAVDMPGLEQRLESLLNLLDLDDRRAHKPQAMSGGEQQRTAIARALICDPAVLLLDEPTGSLDWVSSQQLCETLRGLCDDQGRTIVMVTHEASVAGWADRIVALRDGRVVDSFSTDGLNDSDALSHRYREALGEASGTGVMS